MRGRVVLEDWVSRLQVNIDQISTTFVQKTVGASGSDDGDRVAVLAVIIMEW